MSDFQQVGFVSRGSDYMATYRFAEDEPFFILTYDGTETPIPFETSISAMRAARERLNQQRWVNEPVEHEATPVDVLGLSEWREAKAKERAETEIIVRTGEFRPFKVETKKRKKVKA